MGRAELAVSLASAALLAAIAAGVLTAVLWYNRVKALDRAAAETEFTLHAR